MSSKGSGSKDSYEYDEDSKRPLLENTQEDEVLISTERKRSRTFLTYGKSTMTLTSADAECARGKFEFPTSMQLCGEHVGICLAYTAYMLTSWLDISMRHNIMFPKCHEYWGSHLMGQWLAAGCVGSILVFWLFPIFCCMILLLYLYRDFLRTRIYYTMFAHQVHLDFTNVSFFDAVSVRVIFVWCFLCLFMYPLTGTMTFYGVVQTLPFWIPVVSFGFMYYNHWDIETRLVSVAKLVENDVDWAGNHVKNSFFLRDYIAERAFHKVQKEFNRQQPPPQLTTGEYIHAIAMAAEEDHRHHISDEVKHDEELRRRSHNVTIFWAVSPWYWMRQFLYCPCLVDTRAKNFHFWFTVYFTFTCLLMVFFLLLVATSVITHLNMQGIIDAPIWMTLSDTAIVPISQECKLKGVPTGLVEMASGALRRTVGGFLQNFQAHGALETMNAALVEQNAALQRQSEDQLAQVTALLAEVATLKAAALGA